MLWSHGFLNTFSRIVPFVTERATYANEETCSRAFKHLSMQRQWLKSLPKILRRLTQVQCSAKGIEMKKPAESTDKLIHHSRQPSSVAESALAAGFVSAVAFVAAPSL